MLPEIDTVIIEAVSPEIDGGRFPVKRIVGDSLAVEADIFTHGHDVIQAVLQYRPRGDATWREAAMVHVDNDRWRGAFPLESNTTYEYTVLAWRDPFLSWAQDLRKKHEARQELGSDLLEGRLLLERVRRLAGPDDRRRLDAILAVFDRAIAPTHGTAGEVAAGADPVREVILGEELQELMGRYPDRADGGRYRHTLAVTVDRRAAEFAAWYEMWPRSQGTVPGRSATFAEMERRLDEIVAMGFQVVYLPPIHPIGRTNRKGPNNSLHCPPGSPGCPYAIGNEQGGHTAIEPGLGTLADFRGFERACRARGLELALDLALQISPDHPWAAAHPEWFKKRPDGSIKFAENPPKKYEDIYPIDFGTADREGLWREVERVIRFWMDQGVRVFRVDNPHTKPILFWEWLIDAIHRTDPDVLFFSEAFTRPKVMRALAKAGFSQSYTYFTWREHAQELTEYFTELTGSAVADYLRGNLFTNTPDILPRHLQNAPPAAFKIRATLAATLSSLWGIYNGFELCEGTPLPGREEYLDSEKYDFKVWDWDRPGNIKGYIGLLNRLRQEHPALQRYRTLRFHRSENDAIIFYGKHLAEPASDLFVAVNLDPLQTQDTFVYLPLHELGIGPDTPYQVHDLISGERYTWRGERNFVRLDPAREVAHVLQVVR